MELALYLAMGGFLGWARDGTWNSAFFGAFGGSLFFLVHSAS